MELGWEQAAYMTVSGQNSNNTVRVSDEFMKAVEMDGDWPLIARTNGAIVRRVKARALWRMIAVAAWRSADPGLQFDPTIHACHTCAGAGRINAPDPCSADMFLDQPASNPPSLHLPAFPQAFC